VTEPDEQPCFAFECRLRRGLPGKQLLDRYLPTGLSLSGAEDSAHAALTDAGEQSVAPVEQSSLVRGHVGDSDRDLTTELVLTPLRDNRRMLGTVVTAIPHQAARPNVVGLPQLVTTRWHIRGGFRWWT
jgi:hypothetical protein